MACSNSVCVFTLSDDGSVYSFENNENGELSLVHLNETSIPTCIPNLPVIKQIACGYNFTYCIDHEGFVWSFGGNNFGQLGTGDYTNFNAPQKIQNIPPVLSVDCGYAHVAIITNDSNLWSCGYNCYGQLCLGKRENKITFQKTSFTDISIISVGGFNICFQTNKGKIYACGKNSNGELALGHFCATQITPTLIPNIPKNIVQFVCGYYHSLFLDVDGNVFSVGNNDYGQLGLGHNTGQNVLNQILNIPPIQIISQVCHSSFLIDFEGNLWSFGENTHGQLGLGDTKNRNLPTKIESLKHIQQISLATYGKNLLAKDAYDRIFVTGKFGNPPTHLKEIEPQYSSIWRTNNNRAKSARK